jgi:hypothetical protein
MVAIKDCKTDIMARIDERLGGFRRECALRHGLDDASRAAASDAKKSSAQLSLQRWQVIAALVGTVFASSTATTLVSHWVARPAQSQAMK